MFEINNKFKRYFKREIKTASSWQQLTVNKRVTAIELNHLTGDSFRNETSSYWSETQNSAVAAFKKNVVIEIEQKRIICIFKSFWKKNHL